MFAPPLGDEILTAVNQARRTRGLVLLEPDGRLASAARAHGGDMVRHGFFSHSSAVSGRESLSDRVRQAGGRFEAVGENLASMPASEATAERFLQGWMESPGHRDNLLRPEWDRTGVGVVAAPDGQTFAVQLFAQSLPIEVSEVRLDTRTRHWTELRAEFRVAANLSVGAFVQNRFVQAADADSWGIARLAVELPVDTRIHVGFGKRVQGGEAGWIGIYDGFLEDDARGSLRWRPAGEPNPGVSVQSVQLYEVQGADLVATLDGRATQSALVAVNGVRVADLPGGRFRTDVVQRARTGEYRIDLGVAESGNRYRICRSFRLDTDAGRIEEVEA